MSRKAGALSTGNPASCAHGPWGRRSRSSHVDPAWGVGEGREPLTTSGFVAPGGGLMGVRGWQSAPRTPGGTSQVPGTGAAAEGGTGRGEPVVSVRVGAAGETGARQRLRLHRARESPEAAGRQTRSRDDSRACKLGSSRAPRGQHGGVALGRGLPPGAFCLLGGGQAAWGRPRDQPGRVLLPGDPGTGVHPPWPTAFREVSSSPAPGPAGGRPPSLGSTPVSLSCPPALPTLTLCSIEARTQGPPGPA